MKLIIQIANAVWFLALFALYWVKNDSNADVCSTILGVVSLAYLATIATALFHLSD